MTDNGHQTSQVAQQVMGLFKGAMEIEQNIKIQNESAATEVEPAEANDRPQVTSKVKTANSNGEMSPTSEKTPSDVIISQKTSSSLPDNQDRPYVEIIKNPSPVAVANGHDRKSSVKQEKVLAESYDESLDQFYDVFDQLTTR